MSEPTSVSGAITITPPLAWPEFRSSPLYNAKYDASEVKLLVAERTVDTSEGQVIRRTATGLIRSTENQFNFENLVEHVQAAVDAFPDHEFSGRLECEDHWGAYRIQVQGGRAVKVQPRIVWPEDEQPIRAAAFREAAELIETKAKAILDEIPEDEQDPSDHDRYQEWLTAGDVLRAAVTTEG